MQERSYNADNCIDNPKSVFAVLTIKEKDFLKQNYTCAFYKKGEIIFKEGDKPIGLMSLSEGKVKVFKEGVGGESKLFAWLNLLDLLDTVRFLPKKIIPLLQWLLKIQFLVLSIKTASTK